MTTEKVTLQDTKPIRTMTDFHKAVKQIAESLSKPEYYFPCNVKCNSEGQMEYEIYFSQFSRHFSSSTPEGAIYELQHFVDKNSSDIVIVPDSDVDDISDLFETPSANTFTQEEISDASIWPQVDTDESNKPFQEGWHEHE